VRVTSFVREPICHDEANFVYGIRHYKKRQRPVKVLPVDYLEEVSRPIPEGFIGQVGKKIKFVLYSELVGCRHRDLDINGQLILCG
jgi:hypothetical protein